MSLELTDAHHRYGRTMALAGVDLRVDPGECVALLGPNGAGKTTLVRLAVGLLPSQAPTRVVVAGGDPRRPATRRHLGVVQQSAGLPRNLTVRELVRNAAVHAGLPPEAAGPTLVEAGLSDLARRRVSRLSGGQQQRLRLGMALVGDPSLLVLDEPTVGLDLEARRAFWDLLARRRDRGTGVLVTTHVVAEAASVADRVVLLHHGRVVAEGAPEVLAARLPDRTITLRTAIAPHEIDALAGVAAVTAANGRLRIGTDRPEQVLRELLARDPDLADLRVEGASLEEAVAAMMEVTA